LHHGHATRFPPRNPNDGYFPHLQRLDQEFEMEEMKIRKDKLLNMTIQGRVMKETMTEDGNKVLLILVS
jgi:hypothetical protein